jgi:tRNA(Ile2) C34 agmatinyltransferase TiaS
MNDPLEADECAARVCPNCQARMVTIAWDNWEMRCSKCAYRDSDGTATAAANGDLPAPLRTAKRGSERHRPTGRGE